MKPHEIIALGDLEIDLGARRVTRDGRELELGRLSFDLLEALIAAAPAALSNDEIVARVWSGDAVTDENIKQRVSLLRRALGQRPGREYVQTLRGFGYRLAAEPQVLAPAGGAAEAIPPPPPRPERLARRLLLILAIVSLVLLITVLAIAARQLKRVKVGEQPSVGSVAALQSPSSRARTELRRRLPASVSAVARSDQARNTCRSSSRMPPRSGETSASPRRRSSLSGRPYLPSVSRKTAIDSASGSTIQYSATPWRS